MPGPIRKLVQLVLDRNAARRTEQDAKKSLGGIDRVLGGLRRTALALGATLAAAFGVRAIIRFGRESVRAAAEADAIWNRLAGTLDGIGIKFEDVEDQVRGLARAMQDTTTVGDEDFAMILQNLIAISQDYQSSLANIPVVAGLAASGLVDSFETAATLVGRAMTGNTTLLARYGIELEKNQDAVEVLRERFAHLAENEAKSLQGRITRLNNEWGDFREAIGEVLVAGAEGRSVIDQLTEALKRLTQWVEANSLRLQGFANAIIRVGEATFQFLSKTIDRFDPMGAEMRSRLEEIISTESIDQLKVKRLQIAGEIQALNDDIADKNENLERLVQERQRIERLGILAGPTAAGAARIREASARGEILEIEDRIKALQALIRRINDMEEGGTGGPQFPSPIPIVPSDEGAEDDPVAKALAKQAEALRTVSTLSQLLGNDYDALESEANVLQSTLQSLADAGLGATDERMVAIRDRLLEVQEAIRKRDEEVSISNVSEILKEQAKDLETVATLESLLGDEYDALNAEATILTQTMQALAEEGIGPADERMIALRDRLKQVQDEAKLSGDQLMEMGEIATAAGDLLGAAFGRGIGPLAASKAKQNAILAAEHAVQGLVASLNPFTAATAGAHYAASAKFAGIAAAWGALAGVTGGFSSGGVSAGASAARGVGQGTSGRTSPAGPEIHVHFIGEGFKATNPEVQRVVYGSLQTIAERNGPNAKVKIHRDSNR